MIVLSACVASDGVSQSTRQPEVDLTKAAIVFLGPPEVVEIKEEFVSSKLTVQNNSTVDVCLVGISGSNLFNHNSNQTRDGFREISYEPRSVQLAPNEKVTFAITAELFDMYVFGEGYIQDYGYHPRYQDVVNGSLDGSESTVPLGLFDNIYGKELKLIFQLDFTICNPRSSTFTLESLSTLEFTLIPPVPE